MPWPVIPQEGTLAYATFHIAARLCDVKRAEWHWIPHAIIQHFGGIINRIGALNSMILSLYPPFFLMSSLLESEKNQLYNLGRIVLGHSGTALDIAAEINAHDIREAAEEEAEKRRTNSLAGAQPESARIFQEPAAAAPDAITFLGSPPTTMRVDCDRTGHEDKWLRVKEGLQTCRRTENAITRLVLNATETKPHISVLGLLCENSVHKAPKTELPDHLANHLEVLDLVGFCTTTTKAEGRAHLSPEIKRLFHHFQNVQTIRLFTSEGGPSLDIERDADYLPTFDAPHEKIRDFITDQATAISVTTSSRQSLQEAYVAFQRTPGGAPPLELRYLELVVDNTLRGAHRDGDELQFVREFSNSHTDRNSICCIVVRVTGRPTCGDLANYLHLVFTLFPTQYLDIIGIPNDADYTGLIDQVKPHLTDDMVALGANLRLETKNKSFRSGPSSITNLVVEYQRTLIPPSSELPCIQKLIQALVSEIDLSTPGLKTRICQENGSPKANFAQFMTQLKHHHPNLQIINISDMHKFRLSHFTAMANALIFSRRSVTLLCRNWKALYKNQTEATDAGTVDKIKGQGYEVPESVGIQFNVALKRLIAKRYNDIHLEPTKATYDADIRSLLPTPQGERANARGVTKSQKSPRKSRDPWKRDRRAQLKDHLGDLGAAYAVTVPLIRTGEERSSVLTSPLPKQVFFAIITKTPLPFEDPMPAEDLSDDASAASAETGNVRVDIRAAKTGGR